MALEKRKIHPQGPFLSPLVAGMMRLHEWSLSLSDRINFIEFCIEQGITSFDHADIYGGYQNEALFGEIIKERPELRENVELISKYGICLTTENRPENRIKHYNTSAEYIRQSVEQSLRNLNSEYLDLLLIHRPDPLMDSSELAECLMSLTESKKVTYVGVSNFTPSQFDLLQSKLDIPLVTNQVEYSLMHIQPIYDGTFNQAQKMNYKPMIWSPFAGGRIFHEDSDLAGRIGHTLHHLSEKYNASTDQIALSWILRNPANPIPILGTGNRDRIVSAVQSMKLQLERQDWFELIRAVRGHDVA
jgi:predicted oxidoreductase